MIDDLPGLDPQKASWLSIQNDGCRRGESACRTGTCWSATPFFCALIYSLISLLSLSDDPDATDREVLTIVNSLNEPEDAARLLRGRYLYLKYVLYSLTALSSKSTCLVFGNRWRAQWLIGLWHCAMPRQLNRRTSTLTTLFFHLFTHERIWWSITTQIKSGTIWATRILTKCLYSDKPTLNTGLVSVPTLHSSKNPLMAWLLTQTLSCPPRILSQSSCSQDR